jgi:putative transposase
MNEKAAICYNVRVKIRLSCHSVYRTEHLIILIPKHHRPILNTGLQGYLRKLFSKILRNLSGYKIIEYSIKVDHSHMIMIIPPEYSISDVVAQIEAQFASNLRKKLP